ncbi:hypothetical protein C8039_16945 [Halogeometricum sp. wsp3]|nr:hypothetical protein C8039_16945 [Halogeometricum sp. wsp3]
MVRGFGIAAQWTTASGSMAVSVSKTPPALSDRAPDTQQPDDHRHRGDGGQALLRRAVRRDGRRSTLGTPPDDPVTRLSYET